jgi:hypothetical protein
MDLLGLNELLFLHLAALVLTLLLLAWLTQPGGKP